MSGEAISEETLQASLRDIRLPSDAPGGMVAEVAAALTLTCLAALLVGGVLRLLSDVRPARRAPRLRDRLAEVDALPETARRTAYLHLLKEVAPDRFAALKSTLYQPETAPDTQTIRQELERHG